MGESELMVIDSPGQQVHEGNNVSICLATNDVERTEHIYEALQEEGTVIAPLDKTPFSPAFGSVVDKFGVTFMIVTQV
ncbi:VOC family protein [Alicyclobacillus dauci]|uniref:VOC family protein n=1 Tax=Alicyclobacillus dauci TaxID=1475485 RepID=A0ABY6Z9T7_9BACL|nr:VOC family protein [Alicyclobacillus dauci]